MIEKHERAVTGLDWSKPSPEPRKLVHLQPGWDEIPEEHQRDHGDCLLKSFHGGLLRGRKGIDERHALSHLVEIRGSYQYALEHKLAAMSWLSSLWFEPTNLKYHLCPNSTVLLGHPHPTQPTEHKHHKAMNEATTTTGCETAAPQRAIGQAVGSGYCQHVNDIARAVENYATVHRMFVQQVATLVSGTPVEDLPPHTLEEVLQWVKNLKAGFDSLSEQPAPTVEAACDELKEPAP